MEALLYDHYGWDPYWGATLFWPDPLAERGSARSSARRPVETADAEIPPLDGVDHLHSVIEFKGYTVHAVDGDIGHVENLLADDANWEIRYLVIATRNWWPGKVVQLSPYAVKDIDWFGEHINMKVTRDQVRSAPAWDPLAMTDKASEDELHRHFGWPGYGRRGGLRSSASDKGSRERVTHFEGFEFPEISIVRVERPDAVLEKDRRDMSVRHEVSAHRNVASDPLYMRPENRPAPTRRAHAAARRAPRHCRTLRQG